MVFGLVLTLGQGAAENPINRVRGLPAPSAYGMVEHGFQTLFQSLCYWVACLLCLPPQVLTSDAGLGQRQCGEPS